MECWGIYQRTLQENQRLMMAQMNHAMEQMAWTVGLPPGPLIKIPQAINAPITMNTTNNIHIESGSQVGQINAGALVYLDHAVTEFKTAGAAEYAAALQVFTQATVDDKAITQESQRQILDLLRAVIEQTKQPKETRNISVVRLALSNIGSLVITSEAIAKHWEALKVFFEHLLR
jgi:hypothetical protein